MAISHEEQRLPAILKNNFGFQPSPFGCINNLFYFIYPLLHESFFVETVFFQNFVSSKLRKNYISFLTF